MRHGRFVRALVALTMLSAIGSRSVGARGPFEIEFDPVAAGVTMAFRPDVTRYPVVGNAVIIPTGEGVVLVDGGGGPRVAEQIIARIRDIDSGDLKYLILTHWHTDHSLSLERYVEAFPDLRIIAHPWTRQRMADRMTGMIESYQQRLPSQLEKAKKELQTGLDADTGLPLHPVQASRDTRLIESFEEIQSQWELLGAALPDITTTGGLTLPMQDRLIEIHEIGRGNTPGDLVVYLPAEKILVAGDIVTHPVPFGFPTFPSEVITTTEALLAFDFKYLVLGHGPVQHDREYAEKVLALQRYAVAEILRLHDSGLDRDGIAESLELGPFDEAITLGDPELGFHFDQWYRTPLIGRTLREVELLATEAHER